MARKKKNKTSTGLDKTLTPPDVLKAIRERAKVSDGKNVQKVSKSKDKKPIGQVLPAVHGEGSDLSGDQLPPTTVLDDSERAFTTVRPSLPDPAVLLSDDDALSGERLTGLYKSLLLMSPESFESYKPRTCAEALAIGVVKQGMREQKWAVDHLLNYLEGKPSPMPRETDGALEVDNRLDGIMVDQLNHILEMEDGDGRGKEVGRDVESGPREDESALSSDEEANSG